MFIVAREREHRLVRLVRLVRFLKELNCCMSATELGVVSSKAALAQAKISISLVDAVCFGNVIQSSSDVAYFARHVGLKSGLPMDKPALTIHRLCGSKTCPWHPSKPPDSKHDGEASDSARESISNGASIKRGFCAYVCVCRLLIQTNILVPRHRWTRFPV